MPPDKESTPIIVVEPSAVNAATTLCVGYTVVVIPKNGYLPGDDFTGKKVILWPDATNESRTDFRAFGERITDIADEIKMVLPNGQPHGWNIETAYAAGTSWADLAAIAKANMLVFGRGQFPKAVSVETAETPYPVSVECQALWDELGLARTSNNQPVLNIDNVVRILEGRDTLKKLIWYDEFHQKYFTESGLDAKSPNREWSDIDDINLTVKLQREYGLLKIGLDTVSIALRCYGSKNLRNDPKEWLRALHWDGKERVDGFFRDYFGATSEGYAAAVSRNFWLGMVARIYQPGCQLDNMVILEGAQGIYKSKALEAIGGRWYMEASEEITSKDFFVALAGKLIVEIADLDSFSRADTNRIKKVITCRTDRYRQPYAKATSDHPRQSIFVGTTNEQHYLRDSTGARRFWPITCGRIELDRIKSDRRQLFAEAVTRYLTGEDWYRMPVDLTLEEQEKRRTYDEWENIISIHLRDTCVTETTTADMALCVGVDKGHLDSATQRRIGSILRRLGWISTVVRVGSLTRRAWVLNGQSPTTESSQPLLTLQAQSEPAKA